MKYKITFLYCGGKFSAILPEYELAEEIASRVMKKCGVGVDMTPIVEEGKGNMGGRAVMAEKTELGTLSGAIAELDLRVRQLEKNEEDNREFCRRDE